MNEYCSTTLEIFVNYISAKLLYLALYLSLSLFIYECLHVGAYNTVFSGIAVTEGRKSGDRAPGDFGFNPLNFGKTPATAKDLALKEIRNGRLAMWAAAGILLQGATTDSGALENLF